jgi:DNA processing protein
MAIWTDTGFAEPPLDYTPPPAPDARERLLRLRLVRSRRVGPATYLRLMAEHGHAEAALAALPGIAQDAGVKDYAACPEAVAEAEVRAAKRLGARLLCLGDAAYPEALARITDAPPILWALGDMTLLERPTIAVVGTRNASALGARMARRLARDLGEAGYVVVSGLARGIDALAHEAALNTGTVAVHAGGLDVLYPAENADLAGRIGKTGLRLSEMPFGLQPQGRHFPRRNRIVSGLAEAVIVVEAAARSGSLITARCALDQGREVMAVPGHPLDSRASGGNILLRDGATLVRGADDVIEALGAPATSSAKPVVAQSQLTPVSPTETLPPGGVEALVLSRLSVTPLEEDQLIRDTGQTPRAIAQALAVLEMAGRITRSPGGRVALNGAA